MKEGSTPSASLEIDNCRDDDVNEFIDESDFLEDNDVAPLVHTTTAGGRNNENNNGNSRRAATISLQLDIAMESRACYPVYIVVAMVILILFSSIILVPPRNVRTGREGLNVTDWEGFVQNVGTWTASKRCRSSVKSCTCKNPIEAWAPDPSSHWGAVWQQAAAKNLEWIQNTSDTQALDVVMIGDSITEHWQGTFKSHASAHYHEIRTVYEELFSKAHGASLEGLALGISGDRTPQILYRLRHGELADRIQPRVFWLLIGTNDYVSDGCRVECIVAGNIAIVQLLRQARPSAKIVINSLFPRGGADFVVNASDYQLMNQHLACFAESTEDVYYYDAWDLFLSHNDSVLGINLTLLPDGLHPGKEGSRLWGEAMVSTLHELLRSST